MSEHKLTIVGKTGSQNVVLGLVASVSPGNMLGMQIVGPYPIPTELEMLEVGPKNVFSPVSQVMFPGEHV